MQLITFANLWIDGAWRANVAVEIDGAGRIARTMTSPSVAEQSGAEQTSAGRSASYVPGLTLPGLANAHCHAFQRLLPAWTQRARASTEDFWTWREAMYAAVESLTPDEIYAVSKMCFLTASSTKRDSSPFLPLPSEARS